MIGVYVVDLPEDCTTMDDIAVTIKVYVNDDCIYMAEKEPFTFTMANADEDISQIIKKLKPDYSEITNNVALVKPSMTIKKTNIIQEVHERLIDIMGDLYESKLK